jgi:hypothetical protein
MPATLHKHRGRITGQSKPAPKAAYAAIVLLADLWLWGYADIAALYGLRPTSIRGIIRRWKDA